jgi:glycosyltransferase involved in cell wall biosynthesis
MAMEKAVVASNVGGLLELVQDGLTGLVHQAGDTADLAKKIVRLADDAALRTKLGKNGRAWILQHRQWRSIIETHFEVYERARNNWARRQLLWKGLSKVANQLGAGMD